MSQSLSPGGDYRMPSNDNAKYWIAGIVVLLVVGAGVGLYFGLRDRLGGDAPPMTTTSMLGTTSTSTTTGSTTFGTTALGGTTTTAFGTSGTTILPGTSFTTLLPSLTTPATGMRSSTQTMRTSTSANIN